MSQNFKVVDVVLELVELELLELPGTDLTALTVARERDSQRPKMALMARFRTRNINISGITKRRTWRTWRVMGASINKLKYDINDQERPSCHMMGIFQQKQNAPAISIAGRNKNISVHIFSYTMYCRNAIYMRDKSP